MSLSITIIKGVIQHKGKKNKIRSITIRVPMVRVRITVRILIKLDEGMGTNLGEEIVMLCYVRLG